MSDIDDIAIIQTTIDRMRSRGTQVSQADLAKLAEYPGLVDRMKAAERGLADARLTIEQRETQIAALQDERDALATQNNALNDRIRMAYHALAVVNP